MALGTLTHSLTRSDRRINSERQCQIMDCARKLHLLVCVCAHLSLWHVCGAESVLVACVVRRDAKRRLLHLLSYFTALAICRSPDYARPWTWLHGVYIRANARQGTKQKWKLLSANNYTRRLAPFCATWRDLLLAFRRAISNARSGHFWRHLVPQLTGLK